MSRIFHKILATGLPVAITLVRYNNNNLEENNEEEKESINIELTEKKKDPYNNENAIDFRWSGVKEEDEEDIALANFGECLQKQTDEEIFPKSNWIIAVSYLIKIKIKNIFLEVIFNAKIFYIFSMKLPTTKILSNLLRTRQRIWTMSNTVNMGSSYSNFFII